MSSATATKTQPDLVIRLTAAEIQSGHDRQAWAEGLIEQLPANHDGRNSWLMNYGVKGDAHRLRAGYGYDFNERSRAINPPSVAPAETSDALDALQTVYEALGSRMSTGCIGSIAWFRETWGPASDKMVEALRKAGRNP